MVMNRCTPEEIALARSRPFPIQRTLHRNQSQTKPHPLEIPWSVAEKAYNFYPYSQELERIALRGGFGAIEMDRLHPTWRAEASEITRLQQKVAELEAELKQLREHVVVHEW